MPTPPLLRYALRNAAGHYYYVDAGDNVLLTPTVKYLKHSPTDWDKTEFQIGRNGKHFGIFRKVILPVTFCKDGARIIRHIAFTLGIDTYCKYEIYRRNNNNYNYTLVSEGEVDFSQVVNTDVTASVKAVENGLAAMIESNESKTVDIDLANDPDKQTIKLDGFPLQGRYDWVLPRTQNSGGTPTLYEMGGEFLNFDAFFLNNETFLEVGDPSNQGATSSIGEYFFEAFQDIDCKLSLKCKINLLHPSTAINFQLLLSVYGTSTSTVIWTSGPVSSSGMVTENINLNISISIASGQKLKLVMKRPDGLPFESYWGFAEDGDLSLLCDFTMPTTRTLGLRFIDVFKRVITNISGGACTAQSSYLSHLSMADYGNSPYNTFVTSGTALRILPNAKIKTTLADLVQTAKAVWGLSLGIEGTVAKLEKPEYFLNSSATIFTTADINDFKATIANEHRYNLINVGYTDQDYDELNGRQEVNSEQQWTTGIKNSGATLDLISRYRADPFGVEYVRSRQFLDSTATNSGKYASENTDDSSDNDTFLIHCNSAMVGGEFTLFRNWSSVTGFVVANTYIFNMALTPHRNLCRNMKFIKSGLDDSVTELKFVSGKKNVAVQVVGTETVKEDLNQSLSGVTRLFRYVFYEIECPVPNELLALMSGSLKYGKISFTDDRGNVLSGFPIDIHANPASRQAKKIKLLAVANEDLTRLAFIS